MQGSIKIHGPDTWAGQGAGQVSSVQAATKTARLYTIVVYNNGPDQWIQVFNKASAAAGGAAPDLPPIKVPAGSQGSYDFGPSGRKFTAGIFVGNSTQAATYVAGAADCFFDIGLRLGQ